MDERRSFIDELKNRQVFRAAGLYLVVGWLLLQVSETAFEALGLPEGSQRFLIVLLGLGFPFFLVWAWRFGSTAKAAITLASFAIGGPLVAIGLMLFLSTFWLGSCERAYIQGAPPLSGVLKDSGAPIGAVAVIWRTRGNGQERTFEGRTAADGSFQFKGWTWRGRHPDPGNFSRVQHDSFAGALCFDAISDEDFCWRTSVYGPPAVDDIELECDLLALDCVRQHYGN